MLRPRKAKTLITETADELSLPQEVVTDIVTFYWEEIRKSLSGLKHTRVHVTNLGDFTIKHWKIDEKIKMLENWEETNRQKGMQQLTARFKTAESLFDLKAIKTLIEEEEQRKQFVNLYKTKKNELVQKSSDDLEK